MLNIQTGSSCNKDSFLAGKEAVKALHAKQNPKLAFVYSSIEYDINLYYSQFPKKCLIRRLSEIHPLPASSLRRGLQMPKADLSELWDYMMMSK